MHGLQEIKALNEAAARGANNLVRAANHSEAVRRVKDAKAERKAKANRK